MDYWATQPQFHVADSRQWRTGRTGDAETEKQGGKSDGSRFMRPHVTRLRLVNRKMVILGGTRPYAAEPAAGARSLRQSVTKRKPKSSKSHLLHLIRDDPEVKHSFFVCGSDWATLSLCLSIIKMPAAATAGGSEVHTRTDDSHLNHSASRHIKASKAWNVWNSLHPNFTLTFDYLWFITFKCCLYLLAKVNLSVAKNPLYIDSLYTSITVHSHQWWFTSCVSTWGQTEGSRQQICPQVALRTQQ